MSTRARRDSIDAFLTTQRRLVSCVTNAVVPGSRRTQGTPFAVLGEMAPVPLRGRSGLAFAFLLGFDLENENDPSALPGGILVTDYAFEVYRDGAEFLIYHWHPMGASWMVEPHLHVKGPVAGVDLSKAHLPTGKVTLQAFVRFLILDLKVEPVRADWRTILQVPSSVPLS